MFKNIFLSFAVFVALTPILQGNACSVYKTGMDARRKKRQIVQSNLQDIIDTEQLREYFTACLTTLEPETSQDWLTNVDYSVLDTIWFEDNALLNCGFGLESVECWKTNLMAYIRKYSAIFGSVEDCIDFYATDYSQDPPDTSRFPINLGREGARRDGGRKKRQTTSSETREQYSSCIEEETADAPVLNDLRAELNYSSLSEFIETYTVNGTSTCFGLATQSRMTLSQETWPRRFVALTRFDSPLRVPLQQCGETFFSTVFPDLPRGNWGQWSQWSSCSSRCGSGNRSRGRLCFLQSDESSTLTDLSDCDCNGTAMSCARQQESCNTLQCEPTPYYWSDWIVLSECSATCGEGFHIEIRNCFSNSRRVSFRLCEGEHARLRSCSYPPCPPSRKFLYEPWSSWGPCSVSCTTLENRGVQTRLRCPRGFDRCTVGDTDQRPCPEQVC